MWQSCGSSNDCGYGGVEHWLLEMLNLGDLIERGSGIWWPRLTLLLQQLYLAGLKIQLLD